MSFIQEMLDAGDSQFGIEVLVNGINAGDITDDLDTAIGKTKLQKKVSIKDVRQYIEDGLLTKTIEEYQEDGVCKAGTVGGGGGGRSAGPAYFMKNAEGGVVYPKLYFQGGGKSSDEQKAFRAEFNALMEKHCQIEEAPAKDADAPKTKKTK